jgi:hypothetical protein
VIDQPRVWHCSSVPSTRVCSLTLVLALVGCDKTESDGSNSADVADTEGEVGPEDSEGPATPAEFDLLCMQQTDSVSCAAVPSEYYPIYDLTTWCTWITEYPVTIENDVCSLGVTMTSCRMVAAPELGCGSTSSSCGPGHGPWVRTEGDIVLLGYGQELCNDSDFGEPCSLAERGFEVPPECACSCDANSP